MESMDIQPYVSSSNSDHDGLGKLSFKHLINTNQVRNTKVITHQLLRFLQCIYILIHTFVWNLLLFNQCKMFHFLFSICHGLLLYAFWILGKSYTKSMDIQPYVSSSNPDGLRKLSFKTSLAQLTLCTL